MDGFVEFCEETYQRYDDSLYLILREGEKLGIKVMISIESFSGMYISMRIAELFKTKICLYMKDKYAYTEVFDVIQISVFPKAEIPGCLLYTSPSPRDRQKSRMPSSAWKKKKKKQENQGLEVHARTKKPQKVEE